MATIRVLICKGDNYPLMTFNDDKNVDFKVICLNELSSADFQLLIRKYKPQVYVSIGQVNCILLNNSPIDIRRKWIHFNSDAEINLDYITNVFMSSILYSDEKNPLISVVTTAFKSAHKIFRPFNSLQRQTYTNWEWIIYDDSDDSDVTWELLKSLQVRDHRIKIIKSDSNDGSIGSVKHKVCGMAVGKWLVELDHDDIITEKTLQYIVNAAKAHPDAGFIYSDCSEIYEGPEEAKVGDVSPTNEENFKYGDFFGLGYGSYQATRYNGHWRYQANASSINYKTLRHIVGVPNHVRCWRTDIYHKLGGYNVDLSVADDYDLILRTFCETKFVRIAELCYYQYRNTGGNNFTFLRNSLIQKLVKLLSKYHFPAVDKRLTDLGMPVKPYPLNLHCKQLWKTTTDPEYHLIDHYPRFEYVYKPNLTGLIDVFVFPQNEEQLVKIISSMKKQTYANFALYFLTDKEDWLEPAMNKLYDECDDRMFWWNIDEDKTYGLANLKNYGLLMLSCAAMVTYVEGEVEPDYLQTMITGLGSDESYLQGENLIHVRNEKYRFWLEGENHLDFVNRWGYKKIIRSVVDESETDEEEEEQGLIPRASSSSSYSDGPVGINDSLYSFPGPINRP